MSFDDSSDELARELQDRSRDVGGHPIAFESVRRSARTIQRRRRIAGGAAAAAVLAVAVPAGMAASDTLNEGQQPAGQPTSTAVVTTTSAATPTRVASTTATATAPPGPPSQDPVTEPTTSSPASSTPPTTTSAETTTATPSHSPATGPRAVEPVDLTAAGAVRGANPAVPFVDGRTLMLPDGRTVQLAGDYFTIAPHRDGWVALGADDSGRVKLFHLAADGSVVSSQPSSAYSLAVSHDGAWVLYAGAEKGVLELAPTAGKHETYTFHVDAPGQVSPAGVGTIVQDPVEDRGVIFYNTDGAQPKAWYADFHGIVDSIPPFMSITGSAPEGAVAGQISFSDTGSCSEVMNPDHSKRWQTCDYTISRFSPDGRYILASDDYLDSVGTSQVTVLDAKTGEVVVSYQRPANSSGFVSQAIWEDASHVLALVHEDTGWRILRLDLDGNVSVASRTANADEVSNPLYFTAQP